MWFLNHVVVIIYVLVTGIPRLPVNQDRLEIYYMVFAVQGMLLLGIHAVTFRFFWAGKKVPVPGEASDAVLDYGRLAFRVALFATLFAFLGSSGGVWLISRIGIHNFFSQELSLHRANLSIVGGIGVGYPYYLTLLLGPSVVLAYAAFCFSRRKRYLLLAVLLFMLYAAVTIPLGGRGRTMSILVLLAIVHYYLMKRYRLRFRTIALVVGLIAIAQFWGEIRNPDPTAKPRPISEHIKTIVLGDLSRAQMNIFIYDSFGPGDWSLGKNFLLYPLGPIGERLFPKEWKYDFVRDLSDRFYLAAIGARIDSAVSPSYMGEMYGAFGPLGLILGPILLGVFHGWASRRVEEKPLGGVDKAYLVFLGTYQIVLGGVYNLFPMLWAYLPVAFAMRLAGKPRHSMAEFRPKTRVNAPNLSPIPR